jgi:predicted nucleotide-binding protein
MPIEVVRIGDVPADHVSRAIRTANRVQSAFLFTELSDDEAGGFRLRAFNAASANELLDDLGSQRSRIGGYHPFLIAVTDAQLSGAKFGNLFGSHRAEKGIAVISVANVAPTVMPSERLHSYVLYFLARYALSFVAPDHRNHDETRSCVFDRKAHKTDLAKSMKARPLCDECRRALLSGPANMSARQLESLSLLFERSGREDPPARPKLFIGSSSEGLDIATKVQELLAADATAVVWNQGTVFGLGQATLEALEAAVLDFQFGVFVFSPDDEIHTRGQVKPVARDNVVFELGLFAGKLGRRRAFVLQPSRGAVSLPSDLHGIATATYDPQESNPDARLGPPCNKIRTAIRAAASTDQAV